MKLISDTQGEVCILALAGEIDLHFAPVLRQLLDDKSKCECPALVLDLSEVSFIDSSGIAAILVGLRDAEKFGGIFCIGGISDALKAILHVIRLEMAMAIFSTRAEALAAISARKITKPGRPLFSRGESESGAPSRGLTSCKGEGSKAC